MRLIGSSHTITFHGKPRAGVVSVSCCSCVSVAGGLRGMSAADRYDPPPPTIGPRSMLLQIRPPRSCAPREAVVALALALGAALGACAAPTPTLAPPLPYEPPRVDILDYDVS